MKMEELDLEEDVRDMIAQEATAIVDVLCMQRSNVLQQIYALVEAQTREHLLQLPSLRQTISGVLDYFRDSSHDTCRHFLDTVWTFCENIPLELEINIVSVAGSSAGALVNNTHLTAPENSPRSRNAKRACLDQVQSYTNAVKSFLQKKFEKVTKDIKKKVCLDKTWLCWRTQKHARVRDRPAKNQEGEEISPDHKESVDALLKKTGRVVMLSGQAGSGKTLLMHCLGHHWAQGSYPSIELLFLLEFRQLNLVSQPLSLKELLFRFFLPSEEDNEQSEAVLNYILSNPEKICFIFDGYDEFGARLTDPEELVDSVNAYQQLPLAALLSALCSSKILPGCTVLVTCRPRDVFDLFGSSDYFVAELLGFNQQRVKEYTEEYFHEKGNEIKERAVSLLMDSHHLLSMSHVPGLCHVCCVCLDHFLSSDVSQQPDTQLPSSLTQIYLHILSAFISRCHGSSDNHASLLQRYRVQIARLSELAMDGLENSRIVFPANKLPPELMNFGANAGILSRVDLTCADGSRSLGCAFTHLTMQEFMAALHLMTNPDITESLLKKKLNLKSRWTTKTDPKTVFTDSLHLYMCGLAAEACTSSLALLAGSENARTIVLKRQDAVLKILQRFVVSGRQTGPKIIELCRCAHETQNIDLARAVGSRDRFELRNIRLNPVDIDALAFVTSSANQMVCLDFGACSIEPECLNIIPNCNLEYLIFRSRKYEDKFAEALSGILPKLQSLKQLDFVSSGLTNVGAAKLFKALECCPQITHLNVSDNHLSDESVKKITEVIPKLANLTSVMLGKNSISRNGIFMLIEKMAALLNIKKIYANAKKKEINVLFSPTTPNSVSTDDLNKAEESKELILNYWNLKGTNVYNLCSMLRGWSSLTVLNLAHNSLGNKGLKKLLEHLPTLDTIQEINVSDNEVDIDGVVLLSTYLCTLKHLTEVEASHNGKEKLVLTFSCSRSNALKWLNSDECDLLHKKLSLIECNIQPIDMNRLCKNLIKCPNLLDLDFSHGKLNNESVEKLLKFLPDMSSLNLLNLSHIQMSTDNALLFVQLLSNCQRTATVEFRKLGEAFVKFLQAKSEAATCKFTQYKLSSANLAKLCGILEHCHHLSDLDLSSNFLTDKEVKKFVQFLPKLQISSSVSLHDNSLTEVGALHLLSLMNKCERVAAVEVSLGKEGQQAVIRFAQRNFTDKTFSLRHCCFESSHLQSLVKILTSCPKLKLELSSCTVQSQNLYFLLCNLARLNSVQTLELINNSFSDEAIKYLVTELCRDSNHRTIRIMEPLIKGEVAVRLVAQCLELNPHINEIRVEKTWLNLSFESLASAEVSNENGNISLSAVHSISFDDCEIEGQHLSLLQSTVQKCPFLQKLQFSQLTMGAHGANFLSSVLPSMENLKILSLTSKGETEDEAVIFALQHTQKHLERLSLSHHVIKDSGAAVLGNALKGLTRMRSFCLSQCMDCTAAGERDLLRGLVQCHTLEEIRLDSLQLDEESIACFAQGLQDMTSLRKLSLNKMISKHSGGVLCLLASLHKLTGLEEIELIGFRMGDQGIEELVKHIPKWTTLRKINLSENCVSDCAGEMLVNALSHCRALQQIHLSRNNLGHSFAAVLGQVLPSLSELSELDLSLNQIGSEGCSSLCQGLVSMKALKKLHLTAIGTSDLVNVASCLNHCTSIEDISLSWNKCENDVVLKLAEVLPQCSKLKRIDLEANNINTSGAQALATSLQLCPWIEVIRLWRNPINQDDPNVKDKRLNFSST